MAKCNQSIKNNSETKSHMNQACRRKRKQKRGRVTAGLLIIILMLTLFTSPINAEVIAPDLGTASDYGILAATATVSEETTINGSLGSGAITGTATVSGSTDIAIQAYTDAFTDFGVALSYAESQQADSMSTTSDLGGQTLTPGVYAFSSAVEIGSDTILSGDGIYIFQIDGALTTAADTVVQLSEGAQACNVFWVADVATLGANSTFEGTIMSKSAITLGADTMINGRILAQSEVTANADNTTINVPMTCAAISEPESEPEPEPEFEPKSGSEENTNSLDCTSFGSVSLNSEGNLVIEAMLPDNATGTGTWIFDLGGKTYEVEGSGVITYIVVDPPVGTYQVKAQFILDDNGETVHLELCTMSVPTVTGGQLPDTSTPWYNLLFAGSALFLMGTTIVFWNRRKFHA